MPETMTDTLALFLGLYMLAAGTGLLLDRKAFEGAIETLRGNPMLTYLAAILAFTIGAAIVTLHNDWSGPTAILISLIGWGALIEGVLMLALQRPFLDLAAKIPMTAAVMTPFGLLTVALGVWLLFAALT